MTKSPFLVKKRILEGRKLWGVVMQNQGNDYKMDVGDLLKLMIVDNRTVLVDFPNEQASVLAVVNEDIIYKDGGSSTGKYHFRTVRDNTVSNNFSKVPAIKLITANKLKCLKI